ncbi:beta galactosidase jelly roll domain-containing protein [Flaviramulus sp. BrNp1-15]|uniref:glycoside hydrolase family 2 protein n=1 Tax=Flaviramulus sp. BrNp1-15 TaxID=2916754 RepID=UPI001EE825C5|nr:glycoside hydrolase family 2 TIM barrel-domain containing protein [Flaviramulus sp. BrNp1-15]ULC58171.1 beta galactosidase jelly roll domain-containing protein [Flaviramulus sp. BrNp1-15]
MASKYTKVFLLILVVNSFFSKINSQEDLLINAYNRTSTSLNGQWNYIVDPYENGYYDYRYEAFDKAESPNISAYFLNSKPKDKSDRIEYDFDLSETITVPGDWNTQDDKLFFYEGTVWYKKSFDYEKANNSNRVFVYFGGVNYLAEVYLNGKKIGIHEGGFTSFNFEITSLLKDKDNFLIVKVDNKRKKENVPTLNTDWWNYGGITRDVKLIETPSTYIQDYVIQLDPGNKDLIKGYIKLKGEDIAGKTLKINIEELDISKFFKTNENGEALVEIKTNNISYWSDTNPKLYDVIIESGDDVITDQIGFRTIKTSGQNILLNDKPIFLKGISIHEENPVKGGRANTIEDAQLLLNWAKELGCNYVRLAHYQHNEHMIRVADQMGIMVWEENPVYWTIQWQNTNTYNNAKNQLTELINRDKNRAATIIWSMANETPVSDARNTFLINLTKEARRIDSTRLISAALEQSTDKNNPDVMHIDDPFADYLDVLSFNEYIGWYVGLPERCREVIWEIEQNKPVLISEFGAGAKAGLHGDKLERWTEEFQESVYIETLNMIDKIPQLRGFSPWILVDFRSPRRHLPIIQDGWNRKGLISSEGKKKKAFFVLRKYYNNKN